MKLKKLKLITVVLCAVLAMPFSVSMVAAEDAGTGAEARGGLYENDGLLQLMGGQELNLRPVGNKQVSTYPTKSVSYADYGKSGSVRVINGIDYVNLRAFASAVGASVSYNSQTRTSTMSYGSFKLTVSDGAFVAYANSRPLFAIGNSVIMSDGFMYMPIETLARAMGMRLSSDYRSVTLMGRAAPLSARTPYSEDEIFWLARIIEAESGGEPLLGKIGVGTVVLNRVSSSLYPNTIYGVIFDRKYGVQFSPVLDGRIYNTPSYQSRLAAMICLEGTRVSDRALFFLAPRYATSSWIPQSREYLFPVLHHDFSA